MIDRAQSRIRSWRVRTTTLVAAIACLHQPVTHAQEQACVNSDQGTSYYFVNGVLNDFVSAAVSTQVLRREMAEEGILDPSDRVSLAYNSTQGIIGQADFVEAYAQLIEAEIGPGLNEFGETAFELALRLLTLRVSQTEYPYLDPNIVRGLLWETFEPLTQNSIGDQEVEEQRSRYRSDLLVGEKVVLVAHSQGNLYANQAFLGLSTEEQSSVGIVSIANPGDAVGLNACEEVEPGTLSSVEVAACSVLGDETTWLSCPNGEPQYTTVCRDNVVGGLRLISAAVPGKALPPNFLGPGGLADESFFWHSFQDVYLRDSSTTRSRILGLIEETDASLVAPAVGGDISISGAVLADQNLALIGGARVKVELIAEALAGSSTEEQFFDGVVDDFTNEEGAYSLCVPSSATPQNILVSASKSGFIPQTKSIVNSGPGSQTLDFQLANLAENIVVIEVDPIIHHLGDDQASGDINSQFQKFSEGTEYETTFFLNESQRDLESLTIELLARGLQSENPLSINGEIVAFLNSSPPDGSFGTVTVEVPLELLDLESGVQTLKIESESTGFLFGDFDDFEFVNIIVVLSF